MFSCVLNILMQLIDRHIFTHTFASLLQVYTDIRVDDVGDATDSCHHEDISESRDSSLVSNVDIFQGI
jgi:hypothetical protein